jgi:hypothetical protein
MYDGWHAGIRGFYSILESCFFFILSCSSIYDSASPFSCHLLIMLSLE